jgi:hypothetical protein
MSLKSLPIAPILEEVVRIAHAVFPRETSSLDELLTSPP